jgi:hypothetical protein
LGLSHVCPEGHLSARHSNCLVSGYTPIRIWSRVSRASGAWAKKPSSFAQA